MNKDCRMDAPPAVTMDKLVPFRGTLMPQRIANAFPEVDKFQARPDDVLIASYPKAGTTWLTEITDMVCQGGDAEKCSREPLYNRVPNLEWVQAGFPPAPETLDGSPSPRLLKTHLPAYLISESFWKNNCKIIYVARNAKDLAVSFFFFLQTFKYFESTSNWEEFLKLFMAGEVFNGSWYDHTIGWWEKRNNPNVLYLFYEDMKEDTMREIRKVAQFLEMELAEETLEKIVHHTTFKVMKGNPMVNFVPVSNEIIDQRISPFMRKGVVGDWKNHFTVAQNEIFDEHYAKKMAGTTIRFRSEI